MILFTKMLQGYLRDGILLWLAYGHKNCYVKLTLKDSNAYKSEHQKADYNVVLDDINFSIFDIFWLKYHDTIKY